MLFQNLAGQKLPLYVTDADGYPLTGIAAQLTAYVSVNGGTPQSAGTVTEVGGGHYYISPTQAQTNGHLIQWWATSSLTGIKIAGGAAFTTKLAIPAVQAGTSGGLPTVDSSNYVAGVQNLSSIVASAILSNPSCKLNTNSSGYVTVATNQDKSGYSLTSAYDRAKDALMYTEYTAPDNTSISAIKAKTDLLSFTGTDVKATLDGETVVVATNQDKSGYSLTSAYDRAKDALKYTEYTAPDNASIAAIKAKTDQLSFDSEKVLAKVSDPVSLSSTDVSAIVDGVWDEAISQHTTSGSTGAALNNAGSGSVDTGAIAQAVWQYTTRELTGFSFQVTVGTNLDKAGYSLTTAYDRAKDALKYTEYTAPDNASIAAIKEKTDQLSFDTEKVLAKVSDPVTISSTDVSAIVDGVWDEPAAQHTQTGSTGALLGAAGNESVDYNTIAQAVWQYATRELTGFSFQVTVETNLDKSGYALTSAYDRAKDALKYTEYTAPDNTGIAAIKAQTDKLSFIDNDIKATLDGEAVTVAVNQDKIGYSLVSDYDRAKDALKYTEYTSPNNTDIIAILNQVNRIQFTPENYIRSTVANPETIAQTIFTYDITKAENLAPAYSLTTLILGSLYMVTSNNTLTIYKSSGLPHLTRNLGIDPLDGHISAIRP